MPEPGQRQPLDLLALRARRRAGSAGPARPRRPGTARASGRTASAEQIDQPEAAARTGGPGPPAVAGTGRRRTRRTTWTDDAQSTSTGGTQRQRREGSRPSGKYRSSRPKVASTHQAFSAVTATSQAHALGWSTVRATGARPPWRRRGRPRATAGRAGCRPRRRRGAGDQDRQAGGGRHHGEANATRPQDVVVGAGREADGDDARWRAASTAHPHGGAACPRHGSTVGTTALAGSVPARGRSRAATIRRAGRRS